MAELIDKGALRRELLEKQVTTYYDNMEKREVIGEMVAMIDAIPTTTEAEIRAKAIDEVFEFLKRKRDKTYLRIDFDDLDIKIYKMRLAEQLKEE